MATASDVNGVTSTEPVQLVELRTSGTLRSTFWGYLWDSADLPSKERTLVAKVDASILIFACLGYFCKNIDQSNVNNAFLSGMKEDLNMYGNQLTYSSTLWTVGYIIGQIPAVLTLSRFSPGKVISILELGWGICTLATYSVKSYKALYGLRFLVGLFEAGFFPGIMMILGSWYLPSELAKRVGIFWASGILGGMFSGFLQTAAYENLTGKGGLAGWRWLFIIDSIITIPIAILAAFVLPEQPYNATPTFILNQDDIDIAKDRLRRVKRKGAGKWTLMKIKGLATSWITYVMPLMYCFFLNGEIVQPMGYWLKSFNATPAPVPGVSFTVPQINLLPLPYTAMFAVGLLSASWISDGPLKGKRYPVIIFCGLYSMAFAIALRFLPTYTHRTAHFALYYLVGLGVGGGPSIFAWTNELCGNDFESRSFTIALTNNLSYVMNAIAPNFVWKTTAFPAAHKGLSYMAIMQGLLVVMVFIALFLQKRDEKLGFVRKGDLEGVDEVNSSIKSADGSVTEKQSHILEEEKMV
ncbi:hypothetical protein N7495_000240 [Penicillium taxi]|uniref:uncharacterized protein n=1 Tax=Penicillium taxi TaxID=168475 RepID=UPI0025450986|nr:uncharacterized protein N7495_000240 [Penicillium taxi]KAJ5907558.1 hypothetical protein N7495_000240 [Penicillium taxi]